MEAVDEKQSEFNEDKRTYLTLINKMKQDIISHKEKLAQTIQDYESNIQKLTFR
jgi:hypothetical protein